MASIGHIAVGMAAGRAWAKERPGRAMVAFSVLSMAPDADVVGMAFGVPYGAPWGHRGATHSLVFAAILALAFALVARDLARDPVDEDRARSFATTAALAFAVAASHGLLDAMTDGGRGIALLWPFTTERFFFLWRPIPVAPIGVGFLSTEGLKVATWEAAVFLPFFAYALWPRARDD